MQDKKIFKISTITTIIGIICLILTSSFVMPNEISIKKIDTSKIDDQVQITGDVISTITTKSGTKIIKIADDTATINVVVFNSLDIKPIPNNTKVTITGRVAQYKGQVELIVDDVRNIKIKG